MSPLTRNRKPLAWCAPCPRGGEDSSGSAQSRAPACGRARAGSASGRGAPTRRAAFGSLRRTGGGGAACGRVRPPLVPPSRPPSGGEADGVRCLRVDRSATMCYTAYGWYADAYLKRPGIGACSEISRAFRCVYGRKLPEFHAFHAEFCRFPSNFGKTRTIPAPALAPRRNCVLPVAEGAPVRAPAAAGCAELNKIKLFCIINEVYENVHPILSLFDKLDERKILREIIKLKYAS